MHITAKPVSETIPQATHDESGVRPIVRTPVLRRTVQADEETEFTAFASEDEVLFSVDSLLPPPPPTEPLELSCSGVVDLSATIDSDVPALGQADLVLIRRSKLQALRVACVALTVAVSALVASLAYVLL